MAVIPSRATTIDQDGDRVWVYPRDIPGLYHHVHRWTSLALHAFLVIVPWLSVAGGHRVLMVDLPARRVWVLGHLFTATDGVLIMLMALLAAFSLFFFTSIFGRLWCGYLCPQSVFMINWVLPIEKFIEGDRRVRMKRDKKGFTVPTTVRKAAKFAVFFGLAFALSMSFMGFFTNPRELWTFQAGAGNYGVVAFFTGLWFFDFTYFREQTCNYICPYARFQGALMDDHSLTIGYDEERGDPRGGKGAAKEGRCLDCGWCVEVCPQGIDIRDGFQLECIACGRCVDACTAVMDKASPGTKTLVSYMTIADKEGKESSTFTPRTIIYAVLLTVLSAAFVGVIATRAPFAITVNRAPGSLFQVDADGWVRNTYLVRIENNGAEERTYELDIEGLEGAEWSMPPVTLMPSEVRQVPLAVRVPQKVITDRTLPLVVSVDDGTSDVEWATTFKTPGPDGT